MYDVAISQMSQLWSRCSCSIFPFVWSIEPPAVYMYFNFLTTFVLTTRGCITGGADQVRETPSTLGRVAHWGRLTLCIFQFNPLLLSTRTLCNFRSRRLVCRFLVNCCHGDGIFVSSFESGGLCGVILAFGHTNVFTRVQTFIGASLFSFSTQVSVRSPCHDQAVSRLPSGAGHIFSGSRRNRITVVIYVRESKINVA